MTAFTTMPTRLISFAGSTVAIDYAGELPAKIVDFLYSYISQTETSPHITFRLAFADEDNVLRLYREDELIYEGESVGSAAELLLGQSCYHLADKSAGGLLFHAGGLVCEDKGVLVPGTMGAGKTTLTAWLLSKGCHYLTDELVFIAEGTETMQPFTRPLNLKNPSLPVLQPQVDFAAETENILSGSATTLVPPTLFKPDNILSEPPLRRIIFPHYQAGSELNLQPLSKAQAGLELMQCLINARNLPGHGFSEITRLVRVAPAYKLTYASFAQLEPHLNTLLFKV